MSTTASSPKPVESPPDERLWTGYSQHHELPLAGATSLFVHALVLGILTLGGVLAAMRWHDERQQPPAMDVVMMEGSGGGGSPDTGDGNPIGSGPMKTEIGAVDVKQQPSPMSAELPMIQPLPTVPTASPTLVPSTDTVEDPEVLSALLKLTEDLNAEDKKKAAAKIEPPKMPGVDYSKKGTQTASVSNPGKGGVGNGGGGTGKKGGAPGMGDGTGTGFPGGKQITKQDVFSQRWRFDLTGDGKEHANKLAAIGVTLAVPGPRGDILVIRDLNRRPVAAKTDSLREYKDAVKWYNQRPESIRALAKELQLAFAPNMVVMLLPKEREEKMAAEEARFALEQGRPLNQIRATWFDFQLKDGVYEPVAIKIE
ncbi:MAG: hypothetical protein K2X38_07730 [Gemmataceae bacterium]|nr:hypothetical protein [Gemmataceae bacterium]